VHARFSPSDRDAATVTTWLRKAGLTIAYKPGNNLFITAQGTVAQADLAFRTDLHRILASADEGGYTFTAPVTTLYVPSAVNAVVSGFLEGINKPARRAQPMSTHGTDSHDLSRWSTASTAKRVAASRTTARAISAAVTGVGAPPDAAFLNARPCSAYWGEQLATGIPALPADYAPGVPYAPCGYTPTQLQGAYGVSALPSSIKGLGVRVAVVDAYSSPTILADANTYSTTHGQPAFRGRQFSQIAAPSYRYGYDDAVNGDLCGEQGWYGEETLDVEAVHAMAPGASVVYAGAGSCLDSDLLTSLNKLIDGHKADIISNSWGDTGEDVDPVTLAAYHSVFVQAALEGIGVFFSSGDNGDEVDTAGTRTADYPASDSWVTAVGGTSIGIGKGNNYLFETGWGTSKSTLVADAWDPSAPGAWLYGAGGGTSQVFAQPWYQRGVVPSSISRYFGGAPGRAVPDISAIGDPNTGMLVGQTQTFPDGTEKYSEYRIGGTSLSSPILAGIEALSDQAARHPHGFANPAIYDLAGSRAVRDVVTPAQTLADVRVDYVNGVDDTDGVKVSLRTFNQTESISTAPGYDDVTGVGTPRGSRYVFGLGD
jgi:subtilase family serine protease